MCPCSSLQFPVGRRAACDIYWHGVSFHDNDNVSSGQVNKFPGQSPHPHPPPTTHRSTIKAFLHLFLFPHLQA